MTSAIKYLAGEPIISIEFDDTADEQSVIATYSRSLELASRVAGPVYRVVDVRNAPLSYTFILETIQRVARGMVGAAVEPQMAVIFVGQPNMSHSAVPFFTNREEALAEARTRVAETAMSM